MTEIIINDLTPRVQATANNGQTIFTYTFPIFDAADLVIYKTPNGQAPDDVLDKLILNTNYTVTGVGSATGGTVVLAAAANAGDIITIERSMPFNRTSDYNDAGSFKAQTVNRDFDRGVMMSQQVNSKIEKRGLLYQHSVSIPPGMNVLPKLGPGQRWKANADGTSLVAVTDIESPDASTLRSELESKTQLAPGALLVGYYDDDFSMGGVTLNAYLQQLIPNLNTLYLQKTNHPNIFARALLASDVSHTGTTLTKIIFNNITEQSGGGLDPVTGEFTASVAGRFKISCTACVQSPNDPSGTGIELFIYKNGAAMSSDALQTFGAGDQQTIDVTDEFSLTIGDIITINQLSISSNVVKTIANQRTRLIIELMYKY